ncbi:DDE-type integrase/transposase/recombinase, partial [Escherichia coli]|uniref:DDE-type integrase/transposase/recombinase n=1 Tax=Escherichia coli TaxID=562 RepID=UPI0030077205
YLAVVIDLWSRAVIGWSMSPRMTAQLACDALQMALWRRKRPRCQRQDYWPFFAIFNVRYWSLMLSAFRHFIITDWRGVFCQHSR